MALFEEDQDFIDEDHIHSFAKALVWEEDTDDVDRTGLTPSDSFVGLADDVLAPATPKKPQLISSKSDWYPLTNASTKNVNKKYSTRNSKKRVYPDKVRNEFRSSTAYTLLRWPILMFIMFWITVLCSIYLTIRVYVALLEYFLTWVGERKRLRDKLRASTTYKEWVENAWILDKYLNLDKWSLNSRFSYYDYKMVRLTISRLKKIRTQHSDKDLMLFLQSCVKKNFAGIENRQLYSHRYIGTKDLVEEYIEEVVLSIDKITKSDTVDGNLKRKFFRIILKNYGKSALCLSGGATFAYTHFGLVKALIDNDLMPSVVSGTSGGGIVASLTCTRTNEELKKLLVPELARKITACEDSWRVWIPRWWKTGARFDAVSWARKSNFFTRGSMTFEEAFQRTGRKLNISTVPADPHSPVILCNNITSPHCIIWSSLLASSAVPGILNPVVLMMKNPSNNEVIPFSLGNKWRDGSLRTDIPIDALNNYYNVNFQIVSQVNPHISLFFFAPKGAVGRPVSLPRRKTRKENYASLRGGFIATALEQLCKLEVRKWLQMIKSLDLLPHFLEQDWLNIWLQRFSGTITIWPKIKLKDFIYILSDPTEEQLGQMILKGERSMFPKLLFIKHRLLIERAIERGRKAAKMTNKMTSYGSPQPSSIIDVHDVQYDDDEGDYFEGDISDEEISKYNAGILEADLGEDEDDEDDPNYVYSGELSSEDNEPQKGFIRSLFNKAYAEDHSDSDTDTSKHRRNTIT